jgi:hypothetical protein
VFDSQKRRPKRLEGSRPVTLASGSISTIDKETLAKLAEASMEEIAEFLSASKSIQTAEVSDDETSTALQ